jgi:Dna[CI] antecedent DciA-like protein
VRRGTEAKVTSLAHGLLSKLDTGGDARERARVVQAWRLVAGPEVYSHSRGFALRDEELLVFVDTHTWATELSAMGEHYRAALNIVIGKERVGSLRFAVSKKVREERDVDAELVREADARDPERVAPVAASKLERDQVWAMAAGIHDERVREAVVSAAIAHLEWRKGIEARNAAERALQRLRDADSTAQR